MSELFRAWLVTIPDDRNHGLTDLSLTIREGEILGILGNYYSGGKKLLELLAGTAMPKAGTVFYRGEDTHGENAHALQQGEVWLVNSRQRLIDEMSVLDNMSLLLRKSRSGLLRTQSGRRMLRVVFQEYGMAIRPDSLVRELSQVQRVCVELLAGRLCRAKLLVIDAMNLEGTQEEFALLGELFRQCQQEGITFVYYTKDPELLAQLCNRAALLYRGRILKTLAVEEGTAAALGDAMRDLYHTGEVAMVPYRNEGEMAAAIRYRDPDTDKETFFSMYHGEFLTVVPRELTFFSELQTKPEAGVFYLDAAKLDYMYDDFSPLDNLCLGLEGRVSVWGIPRTQLLECMKRDFTLWYGHDRLLDLPDCHSLFRKDRIAVNLFRLLLVRPQVILCNDYAIYNDIVTLSLVHKTLLELKEQGAAVCMITMNERRNEQLSDRVLVL